MASGREGLADGWEGRENCERWEGRREKEGGKEGNTNAVSSDTGSVQNPAPTPFPPSSPHAIPPPSHLTPSTPPPSRSKLLLPPIQKALTASAALSEAVRKAPSSPAVLPLLLGYHHKERGRGFSRGWEAEGKKRQNGGGITLRCLSRRTTKRSMAQKHGRRQGSAGPANASHPPHPHDTHWRMVQVKICGLVGTVTTYSR